MQADSPLRALQRIVVFSGNLSYSVRQGIVEIDRSLPSLEWLIVVHEPNRTLTRFVRGQWFNLRRNGWRWLPHLATELVSRCAQQLRGPAANPWGAPPGSRYTLEALAAQSNVCIVHVPELHAPAVIERVHAFDADLGLSLAAPILRRSLFGLPRLGSLNLHKGALPDFRGMPPAFWELMEDRQEVGCSVHWVDDRLDTGDLVASDRVHRQRFSTLRGLQLELDEMGVRLMRDSVAALSRGERPAVAQPAGGRTFRKPTLAQMATLDTRMRRLQPAGVALWRRLAREAFSALTIALYWLGLHRLLAPRLTVVLYHRVSDSARDNLTVGVEQFDRQMHMVARWCQPVDLADALAWQRVPRSARPLVAVTFDDGYADNAEVAAPILQRHGLPAAFFVSTGIVDSPRPFPHDLARGNPGIRNMTWQQLRRMQSEGFVIGSHTVSHIDCAGADEATVRDELARSKADLERELGLSQVHFAYPYGGRQHMTAARLALVRQADYAACLSAYGGTNVGVVDPYNVLRRGISSEFSDRAFLRACLGLR